MSNNDFHKKPFDEETQFKLDIYRQYLRSWLPVFLHSNKSVHRIQIFDFFAGPGCDSVGMPGSPLIASEEIKNALENNAGGSGQEQEIHLYLNEPDTVRCHVETRNWFAHFQLPAQTNSNFPRKLIPLLHPFRFSQTNIPQCPVSLTQ